LLYSKRYDILFTIYFFILYCMDTNTMIVWIVGMILFAWVALSVVIIMFKKGTGNLSITRSGIEATKNVDKNWNQIINAEGAETVKDNKQKTTWWGSQTINANGSKDVSGNSQTIE